MSTLSYLRTQLAHAERRLHRYEIRREEIRARVAKYGLNADIRALADFEDSPDFGTARTVAVNLRRALEREEARLYSDPAARL